MLIEQALETAEQMELERLYKESVPVAYVGQAIAMANGWKDAPTSYFNPYEATLIKQQAKRIVPMAAARLFLRLLKEKKVPSWAVSAVDLELIRHAAE